MIVQDFFKKYYLQPFSISDNKLLVPKSSYYIPLYTADKKLFSIIYDELDIYLENLPEVELIEEFYRELKYIYENEDDGKEHLLTLYKEEFLN